MAPTRQARTSCTMFTTHVNLSVQNCYISFSMSQTDFGEVVSGDPTLDYSWALLIFV